MYSRTLATPALTESGGTMFLNFADGSAIELPAGPNPLQQYVADNPLTEQQFNAICAARVLAVDPLLDTPATRDGKAFEINLEAATPGQVVKGI